MPTNHTPTDPSQRALEEATAIRELSCSSAACSHELWQYMCVTCKARVAVAHHMDRLIAQVRAETVAECALLADHESYEWGQRHDFDRGACTGAENVAKAIRSLLSPPPAEEIPKS